MKKLSVIITGATGMVGEGILHECLESPHIEKVLVITWTPSGYTHSKLTEIIHSDFFDLSPIEEKLVGYNACYFCLGTTSLGKTESEYTRLTHTLTIDFATILSKQNPEMTFCYISGVGTDSSERGGTMWARVKGKTENDLIKLPFAGVYLFRPGAIEPSIPLKPSHTYYKMYRYFRWIFAILKIIAPNSLINLRDLARAMIESSLHGYEKNILEIRDIKILSHTYNTLP